MPLFVARLSWVKLVRPILSAGGIRNPSKISEISLYERGLWCIEATLAEMPGTVASPYGSQLVNFMRCHSHNIEWWVHVTVWETDCSAGSVLTFFHELLLADHSKKYSILCQKTNSSAKKPSPTSILCGIGYFLWATFVEAGATTSWRMGEIEKESKSKDSEPTAIILKGIKDFSL